MQLVKSDDKNDVSVASGDDNRNGDHRNGTQFRDLGVWSPSANENIQKKTKAAQTSHVIDCESMHLLQMHRVQEFFF